MVCDDLFLYSIEAYGYEESYKSVYVSKVKYSQEEFADIVFKCYEDFCYTILKDNVSSPCFMNIFFTVEFSIFSDEFNDLLKSKYGLVNVKNNLDGKIVFDLTHYDTDKPNTNRLYDVMLGLDFNTDCWNDCNLRINDLEYDEQVRVRKYCLVSKIKNKE